MSRTDIYQIVRTRLIARGFADLVHSPEVVMACVDAVYEAMAALTDADERPATRLMPRSTMDSTDDN